MENIAAFLVILAMLAVNAVFACYEMALASVSRARLQVLVDSKRSGAQCAVYMKEHLEGSLAVVQLGITLAGAIAAATGGAAIDEWLSPRLAQALSIRAGAADALALVMLIVPLSAATIVFAELVPKMIGIRNQEGVVLVLSPLMKSVSTVFRPVVVVLEEVVKMSMRIGHKHVFASKGAQDQSGLRELRAAASLAHASRLIGPLEERIVLAAAQLSCRRVGEAMVPERDIMTIPEDASMAEALIEAHMHMHTRYPVCREAGKPQTICGYVTFKDIVTAMRVSSHAAGVRGIVRPIRRLPTGMMLAEALAAMIKERMHIALVCDGEVVRGLITMEDIVEELVGDIHDEYDRLPAHLNPIGEGWLAGGGVMVDVLAKAMGGVVFEGVAQGTSLSGYVEGLLGGNPKSGDVARSHGVAIVVRKVRRNRVVEAVVRQDLPQTASRV